MSSPFPLISVKQPTRLVFGLTLVCAMACPAWSQEQCSDVLIPTTSRTEASVRFALDTVNYLDQGSSEQRSKTTGVSFLVPVQGGPPIDVGFNSGSTNAGYQFLKKYNSYVVDRSESFVNITEHVSHDKVVEWGKCMAIRAEFYLYVEPKSITSDSAILKVGNFRRGGAHRGMLSLQADNALVEGKEHYKVELTEIGEFPFQITRDPKSKAVITAAFGGYSPTVTIASAQSQLKTPMITYRVRGNLQEAKVKNEIKALPNFDVSVGVKFASNDIQLTIEQLVDGKVCDSRTISSVDLGDKMNSTPEWQNYRMRAGCQTNAKGTGVATAVQCFVDPVFPGSCS